MARKSPEELKALEEQYVRYYSDPEIVKEEEELTAFIWELTHHMWADDKSFDWD